MKKFLLTMCAALAMSSGAQALETSVAPEVTTLGIDNPKTALYVGNSYSFYNCGVHGYVRGLARAAERPWKARLQTISAGMLSFHDVEYYLSAHEMDPYVQSDSPKMFDVVFLQGMSSESIAKKRIPLFKKYLKQHIETIRAKGSIPVVVVTWTKADKMNKDTRRLADSIIAGPVNAAHTFACGKETWDRFVCFDVEYGRCDVRCYAAHAVVHLQAHFRDVEGALPRGFARLSKRRAKSASLPAASSSL